MTFAALLGLLVLAGTQLTACGHSSPYYRSGGMLPVELSATDERVEQRLLLIGDAGEPTQNGSVLQRLTTWAARLPGRTLVIFLGDNIYPSGMPPTNDDWRREAERRLSAQIRVIKESGAEGIFIPGNHDWDQGIDGVIRQRDYVMQALENDGAFLPPDGCPGPVCIDRRGVRLIVLDSNWWLRPELQKNGACSHTDRDSALAELEMVLRTAGDRLVVFVAHHPLQTHGPHGGFFDWQDHVFPLTRLADWVWLPLPIIGSVYPLSRSHLFINPEDLWSDPYRNMTVRLNAALAVNPPLVYAAGHEHALQILEGGDSAHYLLVSGAGSAEKITRVTNGPETLFAHQHAGFMALDFLENGNVRLRVVEPDEPDVVYDMWLKN